MPPRKSSKNKAAPKKPTRGRKPTKRAAKVSTNNDAAEKTTGHLKKGNYLVIIDWLKIKKNYDACFGKGKAPLLGQPPKGTINGFELMAINLQNQSLSKISLSSRQMKDCFNSYKDKYKKTHTLSLATGFGLRASPMVWGWIGLAVAGCKQMSQDVTDVSHMSKLWTVNWWQGWISGRQSCQR
jgi:hypothetical protein